MKLAKGHDIIIVIIALAVFVLMALLMRSEPGEIAVLEYNGEQIARLKLSGEQQLFVLPDNPNVVLSYGEEGAFFVDSDCPDRVCVNTGMIHRAGEMAACLPNGVVLHIEGDGADIIV